MAYILQAVVVRSHLLAVEMDQKSKKGLYLLPPVWFVVECETKSFSMMPL